MSGPSKAADESGTDMTLCSTNGSIDSPGNNNGSIDSPAVDAIDGASDDSMDDSATDPIDDTSDDSMDDSASGPINGTTGNPVGRSIEERPNVIGDATMCAICREEYSDTDQRTSLDCCHQFHATCIIRLMLHTGVTKCPICRQIPCKVKGARWISNMALIERPRLPRVRVVTKYVTVQETPAQAERREIMQDEILRRNKRCKRLRRLVLRDTAALRQHLAKRRDIASQIARTPLCAELFKVQNVAMKTVKRILANTTSIERAYPDVRIPHRWALHRRIHHLWVVKNAGQVFQQSMNQVYRRRRTPPAV